MSHFTSRRARQVATALDIDADSWAKRRAYLDFSNDDDARLRQLHGMLTTSGNALATMLCNHFQKFYPNHPRVATPQARHRLQRWKTSEIEHLAGGGDSTAFLFHHLHSGVANQIANITPSWYLGANGKLLVGLLAEVWQHLKAEPEQFVESAQSLVKILFLAMGVSLDAQQAAEQIELTELRTYAEEIFASLPDGLLLLSDALTVLNVNHAFCRLFALSPEAVVGARLDDVVAADGLLAVAKEVLANGVAQYDLVMAMGAAAQAERQATQVTMLRLQFEDRSLCLLVIVEPLQEEIRWTRALEEREAALLRAQRVARLGSWQVDLTGGRWHWSPELYRILAIPEEQPPSLSLLLARIHPDDRDLLAHSLERLQGGEGHDLIVRLLLPDGSIRWVRELSEVVWDAEHRPVRAEGTVQDITDQKLAEAKMEALAFFDPLTQLPNRALLTDRLHQALAVAERRRQPLALLFLDLNHFKEINDTLGHEVGDQVLITVAQRLRQTLREAEDAARLGGDEFVVVVSAGPEQASRIAERIAVALAEPLHLAGKYLVISTSIGIALYPSDGVTPQDLLRCADIAMYRAKSEGKFLCFYHAGMGLEMARRLEMAQRLSQAIAQKRLRLAYQAQVALADQRLVGAEVLCRWSDPEWGIVPPAEFIPLAEERGLITSLGEWVLESACRQLREWEQTIGPMAIRIAVNVGARHFETDTYFEETVRQVRDARISPHSIELELTESSMVRDPERAVAVMTALAAEGFSLAIDDFGTGYSSLVYLKRFPVHRLKIDFSFVRDMLEDRNDRAIVSTVIAMGRSLELETIAEGVERPEQAAALQEIGCHYAQGYLFGRPQDADAFAAQWLQQR